MELLEFMNVFVEVGRAKSFRRAADALGIPNSTVSRHIAALERAIGLRLLNRSTRRVEFTEAGAVYFARCQGIVEEARVAHEALRDVAVRPSGTLRVSMPVDLAVVNLAPLLCEFAQTYPNVSFEFDVTPRRVDLQTEPFDLAIRIGTPPSSPSTLVARPLASLTRHLYATPAYIKRSAAVRTPEDLRRHVICLASGAARSREVRLDLRREEQSASLTVAARYWMNSVGLSRAFILQDVGIGGFDDRLVADDVARGRLRRVLPDWSLAPVEVYALTESRFMPAKTRLFIDFVRQRLGAALEDGK